MFHSLQSVGIWQENRSRYHVWFEDNVNRAGMHIVNPLQDRLVVRIILYAPRRHDLCCMSHGERCLFMMTMSRHADMFRTYPHSYFLYYTSPNTRVPSASQITCHLGYVNLRIWKMIPTWYVHVVMTTWPRHSRVCSREFMPLTLLMFLFCRDLWIPLQEIASVGAY